MRTSQQRFPGARRVLTATALCALAALHLPSALAQEKPGGGFEDFAEVDPYSKGEEEILERLGYVRLQEFQWLGRDQTKDVQEALGGADMLWVETEHFKIGSSLATYTISVDADEKKLLAEELARLEKKTGRWRGKKKELDPWLRLHLYAQRAEDLYASFCTDFGIAPEEFKDFGPCLGHKQKFMVLLCERESELSRYLALFWPGNEGYKTFRRGTIESGMFFGASAEALRALWAKPEEEPMDSALYGQFLASVAANFVEGYKKQMYRAPTWLSFAVGHVYTRRIVPRWVTSAGHHEDSLRREDDWHWERDVHSLVANDFFASTEQMFAWTKYEDMNQRDHMVAWAKLEWLLNEAEGDRECFLATLVTAGPEQDDAAKLLARQERALRDCFQLTPAALDEQWAAWVKKNWRRK